ncbi:MULTISPECIES: hypothetical protein [Gracilibacillus]|uniref:hypothetical protein n=1 Tax=Gracilibacillus TaxID=74385 RepID=UPI00082650AF|nr:MULTISPECIES: hypothetical protein [Gracilibacillus]
MSTSKRLGMDDTSGFDFAQEMLNGDVTAAINFDRIQQKRDGTYIIFEYLLCEESQTVNPHTSHPNRYMHKNKKKFTSLWSVTQDLNAILYLVNYAKKGTRHEDKVLLMKVTNITENRVETEDYPLTRARFQAWFRKQNAVCL